jgi:hypothetical protein
MAQESQLPLQFSRVPTENERRLIDTSTASFAVSMEALAGNVQFMDGFQSSYSENWGLSRAPAEMLDVLRGQTVVDLGCGISSDFRDRLGHIGVRSYIGVDLLLPDSDEYRTEPGLGAVRPLRRGTSYPMDSMLLRSDMLAAVSRIPDNSCSFALNGIDDFVVPSWEPYGHELVQQIVRATKTGGYIVGVVLLFSAGVLHRVSANPSCSSDIREVGVLNFESHQKRV